MSKQNASNKDQVVGVFLDESQAQAAIQALKSMGGNAHMADESAIAAFKDSGLEDEAIEVYRSRLNEGNAVVIAHSKGNGDDALGTMLEYGAEFINLKSQGQSQQSGGGQDARYYQKLDASRREYGQVEQTTGKRRNAEQMRLQLRDETLTATKQSVQSGEVELRKVVHEKQEQIPVTLKHEEVYIERHAVDRATNVGEITDMQDEVIRVPVYEEQAQLQKQTRVREEVEIGKKAVEQQQTLTGTTRHEHAEMTQSGEVEVKGGEQTTTRQDYNTRSQTDTRSGDSHS